MYTVGRVVVLPVNKTTIAVAPSNPAGSVLHSRKPSSKKRNFWFNLKHKITVSNRILNAQQLENARALQARRTHTMSDSDSEQDMTPTYKVAIIGDENVGKTSLISRFVDGTFEEGAKLQFGTYIGSAFIFRGFLYLSPTPNSLCINAQHFFKFVYLSPI